MIKRIVEKIKNDIVSSAVSSIVTNATTFVELRPNTRILIVVEDSLFTDVVDGLKKTGYGDHFLIMRSSEAEPITLIKLT